MSLSKVIRTPYRAGVDAHVRDGVVSLKNIVGIQESEYEDPGSVVYLNRQEVIELREWFDEVLSNDHVWEVDGMISSRNIRWPE